MKKLRTMAVSVMLAAAVIPASVLSASAAQTGDINNDGKVNSADVRLLQQVLLTKSSSLNDWQSADLNGDRFLDAIDLSMLKRIAPTEEAEPDPVYIHLKGNSITSEGGNVDISGKNATITTSGTY